MFWVQFKMGVSRGIILRSFCNGLPRRKFVSHFQPRKSQSQWLTKGSRGHRAMTVSAANVASEQNGAQSTSIDRIEEREFHKEASESYLAYAMSVVVGRALPDVRDGLKPVHRRILYAMHELGLVSSKPHKKCARVVGEVLGKFHPHGDSAVYDALVRMAQDFSMQAPLVSGHGNFGSIDNDPAAAMRYTECRLQSFSMDAFLEDLESNTVDFVPTFDGSMKEPSVLPSKIPNLLVNGSSGIAVGVATRIPPHNMTEIVGALKALIKNPKLSVEELLEFVPGPDFPTGGEILRTHGLREAYTQGRGSILMRAKATIEEDDDVSGNNKKRTKKRAGASIIITELPYQIFKSDLVETIANLVENHTLEGISDIRDESDREGIRIVVEVKKGAVPQVVLNNLFKQTKLQSSFPCNMVALVNGTPKSLNLKEFLEHFLKFRCQVVERRAKFDLKEAEARLHLVEGFLMAMKSLDSVITVIRKAKDAAEAKRTLQSEYDLSSKQVDGILGMSLRRLTSFEAVKLGKERDSLTKRVTGLNALLESPALILKEVDREASAIEKKHRNERRSVLVEATGVLSERDILPNDPNIVVFSKKGFIKRMKPDAFTVRNRGCVGVYGANLRQDDTMEEILHVMLHDRLLFFTESGLVYNLRAYQVPVASRTAIGRSITQVLPGLKDDRITRIVPFSNMDLERDFLLMLTEKGKVKKTPCSSFKHLRNSGLISIKIQQGDKLCWVGKCRDDMSALISTDNGFTIRFDLEDMRPTSRSASGVKAIRLTEGASVIGLVVLPSAKETRDLGDVKDESSSTDEEEDVPSSDIETSSSDEDLSNPDTKPYILFFTAKGLGKRVSLDHFPVQGRAGKGRYGVQLNEGDSLVTVQLVGTVPEKSEVIIASVNGMVVRMPIKAIPIYARFAKGVKVMNLKEGDLVQGVTTTTMEIQDSDE
ncbi:hypothetical protein BSKO_07668 [Bryopsis sp. KO-2023]|nr:hypothetical protein BSKO_07668 [Bryopsis sp. KO-2023]